MIPESPELSALELRAMAFSTKTFIESRAGQELMQVIQLATESALTAIQECTDYRESTELVIRYQQRFAMAELIRQHIEHLLEPLQEETGTDGDPDADTEPDTQYTN